MGRRRPAPTASVGRDSGLPEHPQFLPAPSQGSPGCGTCGCRAGGAAPAADPRGHGAGRGANRRRVSPHCPRPRHSPPIHLPARQIPAPGHDNICLLLRVQLTCCRLLLRHRPFPPTATVTATAATVTAVTATAAATAAPHGVTARPFFRSRPGASGSFQVENPQWEHWDLSRHLPSCEQETPRNLWRLQGRVPVLCPPPLLGTRCSVGVKRDSSAVPCTGVGRGYGRGWHGRVPVQPRFPRPRFPAELRLQGRAPHIAASLGPPEAARCPWDVRCPGVCSAPGAPGRAALPVRQLQPPVPP